MLLGCSNNTRVHMSRLQGQIEWGRGKKLYCDFQVRVWHCWKLPKRYKRGDSPDLVYSVHPDFLSMQFQAFCTVTLRSKAAFLPLYPSTHSILHLEGDTISWIFCELSQVRNAPSGKPGSWSLQTLQAVLLIPLHNLWLIYLTKHLSQSIIFNV